MHREGVEVEGPVSTVGAALDIVHARRLDTAIIETSLRGGDLAALQSVLTAKDVPVAWITDSSQGPANGFDRSADPARYLRRLLASDVS